MRIFSILLVSIAMLWPGMAMAFDAPVVNIIDGDTIKVRHECQVIKTRLLGINTPDRRQGQFKAARAYMVDLVENRSVRILKTGIDPYGRVVGWVYVGEKNVNVEMIQAGWATHDQRFSKDPRLIEAQKLAKAKWAGLWGV